MNIFRFCNRYKVSLNEARDLETREVLRFSRTDEPEEEIRYWLYREQHLRLRAIVTISEDPSILHRLRHFERERVLGQLRKIGDPEREAAPHQVVGPIATRQLDAEAIKALVWWLRSVIPSEQVCDFWVASRLVFGLPKELRKDRSAFIRFALKQCREHPDFAGWWRRDRYSRVAHTYQRPKIAHDL